MASQEVYIIGSEHHNTLSIVRCFGAKGLKPIVLVCGATKSCIQKSIYAKDVVFFATVRDAILYLKEQKGKGVIIACTDDVSWLLDMEAPHLSEYEFFHVVGSKGDLMEHYMDKQVQIALAQKCGIKVPVVYDKANVSFPCIIKPLESKNGGKHISRCTSKESFDSAIEGYGDTPVTIQQLLTIDEEIVLVGLRVNGEVIMPAYVHKIREYQGGTTYSSIHPISKLPKQLVDSTKQLVTSMNYEGLFGVEYIRMRDEYYFVEANLRNDATCYSIAKAGVNLPYIYYLAKTNQDYKPEVNQPIKEIHSMVEVNDIFFGFVKKKVSFKQWYKEYKSAECKYFNAEGDEKPFAVALRNAIIERVKNRL